MLEQAREREGGSGVRVAVLDTGWDESICDLRVKPGDTLVWSAHDGRCLMTPGAHDDNGHGTLCTNLILKTAPHTTVHPVKILDSRASCQTEVLIEAIRYSSCQHTLLAAELHSVCRAAVQSGACVVAAQSGTGPELLPGAFSEILSVRGTVFHAQKPMVVADESGRASLSALGDSVGTIGLGGRRAVVSGDSVACAIVVGCLSAAFGRGGKAALGDAIDACYVAYSRTCLAAGVMPRSRETRSILSGYSV
jgi:hypothetical protein